ncbi:PH domain-containing protein [Clostridium ihumii]|uniref:PH domain-containing protein n=1 Tax=Clostridium ihumii TaxID=1470356 RepID=UPI000553246E|nr:PH domain-containing protein [Clostridium ihumii]
MFINIILFITALTTIIAIFINNSSGVAEKNNIILGVTLPSSELKNSQVLIILDKYKKANKKFMCYSILLFLPTIIVNYISLKIAYLFLWIFGLMYINYRVFIKYNEELKELKREKDWFIKNRYIINIDTEVTRLKDTMVVSKTWFIPSLILSIIPILIVIKDRQIIDTSIIYLSFIGLIGTIIFIFMYNAYCKDRTKVFSEDSKINLVCNKIFKKNWTLGCVIAATIQSLSMLFMFLLIKMNSINMILILIIVIAPSFIILGGIYIINEKVRNEQNKLIKTCETPIYSDEDEYWKYDIYNNPNDSRTMVAKRVGYGMTYNMGTKKGRNIVYISYILTAIFLVGLVFMFIILDFTKFNMNIRENKVVMSAPMYSMSFDIDQIEDIKIINSIPKGVRTNGASTENYSLGHYNIDGYGKSMLYVYSREGEYIVIKLKDKYVFVSGENKKQTDEYYKELISNLNKN